MNQFTSIQPNHKKKWINKEIFTEFIKQSATDYFFFDMLAYIWQQISIFIYLFFKKKTTNKNKKEKKNIYLNLLLKTEDSSLIAAFVTAWPTAWLTCCLWRDGIIWCICCILAVSTPPTRLKEFFLLFLILFAFPFVLSFFFF